MKFNILVNLNKILISGSKYHNNILIYPNWLNHLFNRIKIRDFYGGTYSIRLFILNNLVYFSLFIYLIILLISEGMFGKNWILTMIRTICKKWKSGNYQVFHTFQSMLKYAKLNGMYHKCDTKVIFKITKKLIYTNIGK